MATVVPVSQSSNDSETEDADSNPIVARLLLEKDTWKPYGNLKVCCGDLIMVGPIRSWWWILEIYTIAVTVVFIYEHDKYESIGYPIAGAICYLIVLITSWKAICCNPGVIKRPPFEQALGNAREVERMTKSGVPYPSRRVEVGDDWQTYSYCMDCHHFKPPRTGHCHVCDVCVERMDHHCPIVGLCVGKNNLVAFQLMAISMSLYHLILLFFGIILLIKTEFSIAGQRDGFNSNGGNWWEISITLDMTVIGFLMAMLLPAFLSHLDCEQDPPRRRALNRWVYGNTQGPIRPRSSRTNLNSNSQIRVSRGKILTEDNENGNHGGNSNSLPPV